MSDIRGECTRNRMISTYVKQFIDLYPDTMPSDEKIMAFREGWMALNGSMTEADKDEVIEFARENIRKWQEANVAQLDDRHAFVKQKREIRRAERAAERKQAATNPNHLRAIKMAEDIIAVKHDKTQFLELYNKYFQEVMYGTPNFGEVIATIRVWINDYDIVASPDEIKEFDVFHELALNSRNAEGKTWFDCMHTQTLYFYTPDENESQCNVTIENTFP